MLSTAKSNREKLSKEYNQLTDKVTKLQSDLEEQIHQNANLLAENGHKQLTIKSKEEDIATAKAETTRVTKIQAQTLKKLRSLEEARESAEKQRDTLKLGTHSSTIMPLDIQLSLNHVHTPNNLIRFLTIMSSFSSSSDHVSTS